MLLLVVVVAWAIAAAVVPPRVDAHFNPYRPSDRKPSEAAERLHAASRVVDLHADSLIWGRDLLARNDRGHVDLPRLLEGNVAVQVFSVPTHVPKDRSQWGTRPDGLDMLTLNAVGQGWPPAAWLWRDSRAIYLARLLDRLARRSNGGLRVIRTVEDLDELLIERESRPEIVGAILALEGIHGLSGDPATVDRFVESGYRIAGLVHFHDNEVGGSATGMDRGGLTALGREVVETLRGRGVAIDLAHASPQLIDDILALDVGPLIASHTGVRGTCDRTRNLSDDAVRGIAASGGVVGIGYWQGATCAPGIDGIARAARYVRDLVGVEHVALGSDFDGGVSMTVHTGELALVTDALLRAGFSETEVGLIIGENVLRVLRETLPTRADSRTDRGPGRVERRSDRAAKR